MNDFEQTEISENSPPKNNFHSLGALLTFILLPPLWALSIPALVFSQEAKKLHSAGEYSLAESFSEKAKRFYISAWAIAVIILLSLLALVATHYIALI